jgi:hypothetical protein
MINFLILLIFLILTILLFFSILIFRLTDPQWFGQFINRDFTDVDIFTKLVKILMS